MTLDEARDWLSIRLTDLRVAEQSGDPDRIRHAQAGVENAQDVLCEVTLRDEGGWKP